MQVSFIDNMMTSIQNRIYYLRMKYRKASSSLDLEGPVDIEHTSIELSQQAKYVDVYYNASAVSCMQKIIALSNKYIADHSKALTPSMEILNVYVSGWSEMKEITKDNLGYLDYNVSRATKLLATYQHEMEQLANIFDDENSTEVLVDHLRLSLYTYTTEFPYRRAYYALMKKSAMKLEPLKGFISTDVQMLDKLIIHLKALYAGWEICGKDEAFEEYRSRQISLINAIHELVDAIETDIHLAESFITYGTKILNFKVYPVIRKNK